MKPCDLSWDSTVVTVAFIFLRRASSGCALHGLNGFFSGPNNENDENGVVAVEFLFLFPPGTAKSTVPWLSLGMVGIQAVDFMDFLKFTQEQTAGFDDFPRTADVQMENSLLKQPLELLSRFDFSVYV